MKATGGHCGARRDGGKAREHGGSAAEPEPELIWIKAESTDDEHAEPGATTGDASSARKTGEADTP